MITDEMLNAIRGCEADEVANLLIFVAKIFAEKTREEMAEKEGESQTLNLEANGVSIIEVEICYNYEWVEEVKKALKRKLKDKL